MKCTKGNREAVITSKDKGECVDYSPEVHEDDKEQELCKNCGENKASQVNGMFSEYCGNEDCKLIAMMDYQFLLPKPLLK